MKKIFLALAAVAALASCVKENTLVPEQTADNLVTITAVSADTKTTLDGANVLWQDNDAIKVVLTEGASYKYDIELTTSLDVDAETAEFTFTAEDDENVQKFNDIKADSELDEKGYAIYPSTSAQYLAGFQIIHELSEEQDGTVDPGMNLSSALVTTADIQAGEANAMFNNALTLLQIKVPAGVTSVSLTANYGLAGTLEFNKPDAEGKLIRKSYKLEKKTVTLSTGSELDPGTYSVLVFPGTAETLTLRMTGDDLNDVYESTLNNVTLMPGTYRTINLTEVFAMGVEAGAEIEISSVGGEKVISVADVEGYTYTVEESADWLEAAVLETRSFSGKEIVLTAGANLTGSSRSTDVTISWSDQSRTFTVSQDGISSDYLEFVYDDPADPENSDLIQWSESFKIYANADDANAGNNILKERSGQFTIEFTEGEECEYGMYKITGLFFTDSYFSGISGIQTNKGGVYYADYDSVNKKLTVHNSNAEMSYFFTSDDVVLEYDSVNKSFSISDPVSFNKNTYSEYNKAGVIYNYEATVYVAPDPGEGGGDVADLSGTWNQTVVGMSWPAPSATMTITVDGSTVTLTDFVATGTVVITTFENNQIVVPAGTAIGSGMNAAGSLDADVVLTLEGNTFTAAPFSISGYMTITSYSATNPNIE